MWSATSPSRFRTVRVVGILGRNGVGKTTTVRAIMGIVPRRQGRIALDGREIQALPANLIARAGVAYVPQGRQLFPHLTVRENLQLAWHGNRFGDAEVQRGIAHFPPLGSLLDRHAGNLSGGEQQMVAIGRALLNAPRAVLLDEPTEGLAPLFVNKVREVIAKLRDEGIAVLLIEQNLHMALSVCQYLVLHGERDDRTWSARWRKPATAQSSSVFWAYASTRKHSPGHSRHTEQRGRHQ